MYRVLVIEDNFYTRNAILKTIDWAAYRCELAGQAINGTEGEEKALALRPQIVITDIRMPGCDGIELISRLRKVIHPLKVIVVTGYKSFDYAHAFVWLGATDFLLKPLDPALLGNALQKAVAELDSEQVLQESIYNALSRIDKLNEDLYKSQEMLQEKLLGDILSDSSADEAKLKARFVESIGDFAAYGFLAVSPGAPDLGPLSSLLEERYSQMRCIPLPGAAVRGLMVRGLDAAGFQSQWLDLGAQARGAASGFSGIAVMTPAVTRLQLFAPLYDALLRAVAQNLPSVSIPDGHWEARAVAQSILGTPPEQLPALLERTVSAMFFLRKSIEGVRRETIALLEAFEEISRGRVVVPQSLSTAGDILSALQKARSGKDILDYLKAQLLSSYPTDDFSQCSSMVRSVYAFLCTHYAEDISLNSLSDIFYLTPNYLSSLIKRETGRSFTDILTSIRIDQAKKLLCDPRLHIRQISAQVGYSEYPYFYQVFKKHTGLSPKAFRRNPGRLSK